MYFGIRVFDMRLGVDSDGELKIFHSGYETHLSFDTAIRQAFEFLDKNPGEAIIMFIKYEHGGDIKDKFTKVLNDRNSSGRSILVERPNANDVAGSKQDRFRKSRQMHYWRHSCLLADR